MKWAVMSRRAWALSLLLLSTSSAAAAQSRWQRAADPGSFARERLHQQAIVAQQQSDSPLALLFGEHSSEGALRAIEAAGIPQRADALLEFDRADLLAALGRNQQAIEAYQLAISRWPDSPRAIAALLALAFAHAKLDLSEGELHYYRAYLRAAARPWGLATATMNMAEAQMRLGRLHEAITGYREAYRLASQRAGSGGSSDTAALSAYGLAVALDRQGDPRGAEEEMLRALSLDPQVRLMLAAPHVFFVPAYERAFYIGLAFETKARQPEVSADNRRQWTRRALSAYREYLQKARTGDLWLWRVREREQELAQWQKRHVVEAATAPGKGKSRAAPPRPATSADPDEYTF